MGEFSLSLNNLTAKINDSVEDTVKGAVFELTKNIIYGTPFDTGRARINWQVDLNSDNDSIIESEDKTGNIAVSNAEKKIKNNKVPLYYMISNNLPYIERLEYGWSKAQAPQGMVRINIARFNQIFKQKR